MVVAAGMPLAAQVVVFSGQVNFQGTSVPYAPIQICVVTSTGTPCVPTASIYSDYNLAHSVANPNSADANGNYTFYAASLPIPSFYIVQVTPIAGTIWSYVVNGGGNGSGCLSGNLVANGCTGATTAAGALVNLGTEQIAQGGTGATTAAGALANLNGISSALTTPQTVAGPLLTTSTVSSAPLGPELTTNGTFASSLTGWTDSGSNWSASGGGATHSAGAVDTLSQTISITSAQTYQLCFTLAGSTAGSIAPTVGGVVIYVDGPSAEFVAGNSYCRTFVATTGALVFTPTSDFNGTLQSVSVKLVTLASVIPALSARNSDGSIGIEVRPGGSGSRNTFMGTNVGQSVTPAGIGSTALGYQAFSNATTSYNDVAIGDSALYSITGGYQDTAVGANAMYSNLSGAGNSAVGFDALQSNVTGFDLNAFGEFALQHNTTGSENAAFGVDALLSNTTGSGNVAMGGAALLNNTTGSVNVAVGRSALGSATAPVGLTAVGSSALGSLTTGTQDGAFGDSALGVLTTGNNNNAFGFASLYAEQTGSSNTAIGRNALATQNGASNNTAIGEEGGSSLTTGSSDTCIGYLCLLFTTTGSNNTAIGVGAGYGTGTGYNVSGSNNTWIGYFSGASAGSPIDNSTAIGNGALNSVSNEIVFGNTAVGDVYVGSENAQATMHANEYSIGSHAVIPPTVTSYHGSSGTKVQLSDGTGTSGYPAVYASDGSLTNGPAGMTGSCAPTTTLTVVKGIITGCS